MEKKKEEDGPPLSAQGGKKGSTRKHPTEGKGERLFLPWEGRRGRETYFIFQPRRKAGGKTRKGREGER